VIDKSISTEQFTLAYWYFKDLAGKPIAITNVGYQSRDDESAGLMDFLSELMQSYILLFLLASLAAYLLSTYITRSLQTIQERLQNVQFGQRNDPILWESQDEIGSLVNEYNRMLGELEISANKLAQQERESAWREMAKQVAHEIKNPLTPMKLRVQHLERTRNDDPTHFDDKLKQFCVSMTEQIDTLTRIADEFSLFAKMPKPVLEKVDLFDLAQDVINLYLDNGRAEITFRPFPECAHYVLADKNHVIRALNNLIMNAIQAFPERTSGKIEVAIRPCGTSLFVRVSDNGPGIPAEQFRSIFSPNFTTKSTGTGLGLSMVKNMIESAGGKVWFRSRINRGASFYFSLPVWKS
jgi:two-component system, NtrC family, nitrogen regulation sensor histidine kinase NtrY